ncbi:MAG: carbohydrate binding family 9 domain-containing protein [Gemmatimonadetes bacterium]|nr:carbohydrate binding family 9 domain-containing protein [Gemmatimonadota bacterium]
MTFRTRRWAPIALVVLLAGAVPLAAQEAAPTARPATAAQDAVTSSGTTGRIIASGVAGQITVQPPRVAGPETELTLDGVLDEMVWQRAALLTGFSQFQPVDGSPAEDSTEVLVWYSPNAIYFGVRAFEPHGATRATLATRDKIQADDAVHLLIDTFNDRRRAMDFGVNPLGVQSDGNLVEGLQVRSESKGHSAGGSRDTVDLSADFVFQSKGRLTDYGYEVEIRIPFKSLPFQAVDPQTWGINVIREVRHSAHEDTWTAVKRANASFLAQSGKLTGLTGLSRGLVLDLVPEITGKITGAAAGPATSGWSYDASRPKVGGSTRWGISNNLTLSGTANPDFSQVEADAQQVQSDPRRGTQYAEKRPFFLEGIDQFQVPNSLIYTRRVVEPVAALKLAGKMSNTSVGFLSAVDTRLQSASGTENPVYNIVRVRRDIGKQSNVGVAYTDRIEGGNYNRMASVDGRIVFAKAYSLRLQAAGSLTRTAGVTTHAPMWDVAFERSGRKLNLRYQFNGFSPDFQARAGFIGRSNSSILSFNHRFTFYGRPKSLLESFTWTFPLSSTWNYRRMMAGIGGDLKNDNSFVFVLRRGWRLSFSFFDETFKYDPDLYANYAVERRLGSAVDTVKFTGTDRLTNFDLGWTVQTPQTKTVDAFASVFTGWDDNFSEWSRAWYWNMTFTVNFRPSDKLRVSGNLQRRQYDRLTDRTTVLTRTIPYVKAEYQLSRPIFFRIVAQYDIQWRDSLRDDSRTNFPLLIRNARTGGYEKTRIVRSNDLRVDWLFSYQPTPGTVFFAGYGSSLTETDPFRFRDLRRVGDGFFVKLSYLFRV